MSLLPAKPIKAVLIAIAIWMTGFIWGSIVFMTPSLKSVQRIEYISSNPAISFPLLILWPILTYFVSRAYLKGLSDPAGEGKNLGVVLSFVNFVLDLVVLVFLLHAGSSYFKSQTVWLAYLILLFVPWWTGARLGRKQS
jgi:hypothetical protein